MKPFLVYDCEIINAIPSRNEPEQVGISYCNGWRDFANMGISVIGAYDYATDRNRVFCVDNFDEFAALARERTPVAFNGHAFDDQLVRANGIEIEGTYDMLVEVWAGIGLGPQFNPRTHGGYTDDTAPDERDEFNPRTHGGYGLDPICEANFGMRKTGNGALAPILWQQGKRGAVIDYCMNDVAMEAHLLDHIIKVGWIVCPKTGKTIVVRRPWEVA